MFDLMGSGGATEDCAASEGGDEGGARDKADDNSAISLSAALPNDVDIVFEVDEIFEARPPRFNVPSEDDKGVVELDGSRSRRREREEVEVGCV